MDRKLLALPSRRNVVRLCCFGTAVVGLALFTVWIGRLAALPADWIATTAKYVGLLVSSVLGVVGTATDTKELTRDGTYRLRPVGWAVVVSIFAALVIGALGQHFQDLQQARHDAEQVRRLQGISQLAQKTLKPFSGRVELRVLLGVPVDQRLLKDLAKAHEHLWFDQRLGELSGVATTSFDAMRHLRIDETKFLAEEIEAMGTQTRCLVTLSIAAPPGKHREGLMYIDAGAASLASGHAEGYYKLERMATVAVLMANTATNNQGMYSAMDFVDRQTEVTCFHAPQDRQPGTSIRVGRAIVLPLALEIYDGALKTPVARVPLHPVDWEKFDPRYSSNMTFVGRTQPSTAPMAVTIMKYSFSADSSGGWEQTVVPRK